MVVSLSHSLELLVGYVPEARVGERTKAFNQRVLEQIFVPKLGSYWKQFWAKVL